MNGKIGFWRWLLLKIWKGIKTIPKLPKLMRDIDPAFEMTFSIIGFLLGMLLFSRINYWMGFLAGVAFAFLIFAHAFYRMEMKGDC